MCMAAHIFVVDEKNFKTCIQRGIAGLPMGSKADTNEAIISRISILSKNDMVMFYVTGIQELHGVWSSVDYPFFDETKVWDNEGEEKTYPYRIRITNTKFTFRNPISLTEIYDLRDNGMLWTFNLRRPSGTNAMFSITNIEYNQILNLFLKKNPFYLDSEQIREPYKYFEPNLLNQIQVAGSRPKYEYTLMALLLDGFSHGRYKSVFGEYGDFVSYVPTSFGKEIDILLLFQNPDKEILAYNLIEVKRDEFDKNGLKQLLQYEDWFIRKKVHGDFNMVRTTAIAKKFSSEVVEYVSKRQELERKEVSLLEYKLDERNLKLRKIN